MHPDYEKLVALEDQSSVRPRKDMGIIAKLNINPVQPPVPRIQADLRMTLEGRALSIRGMKFRQALGMGYIGFWRKPIRESGLWPADNRPSYYQLFDLAKWIIDHQEACLFGVFEGIDYPLRIQS